MSTITDVCDFYTSVRHVCEVLGATREFDEEFHNRWKKLSDTINAEGGISLGDTKSSSSKTELGPQAEKIFQELKDWACKQKGLQPSFAQH